jgi:hypothetical protein
VIYLTGSKNAKHAAHYDDGTIGLLNTPASNYTVQPGWTWAADNGCFNAATYVGDEAWFAWLEQQPRKGCLFATAPDVVGDHEATVERSLPWLERIRSLGFPAAFVLQNGATVANVPWDAFDVAFVGGDDAFKLGGADHLIYEALIRGKRVHIGRVNSGKRYERFAHMHIGDRAVDSCDGTFLAFGPDVNLPRLLSWVRKHATHPTLWMATT